MANEINNISHAGIVCTFIDDATAPVIQASWGIDEDTGFTQQAAIGLGVYTIPLRRTIGALTGPNPGEVIELGGVVLQSAVDPTGLNRLQVLLVSSEFLAPLVPPVNTQIQLDLLLFSIQDETGAPADAAMNANVEVRRVPQQD